MSTARDIEGAMLERCLQIVTTPGAVPRDQAEANVCRLAGMIVDGRYPEAGKRLSDAATAYFADHPEQQVPSAEVVRRGWIINAPRLRDRLELSFSEGDCTSSLGWPPCVHRTSDRERSEVLCTKRRERSELLRTLVHGATKPEPPKIPAINRQAA